jgi:hypothetical protein
MCCSTGLLVSYKFIIWFYNVCKFVCQIILKESVITTVNASTHSNYINKWF